MLLFLNVPHLFCHDLSDENLIDGLALNYERKMPSKTGQKSCV